MNALIAAGLTIAILPPFSLRGLFDLWRSHAAKRWPKTQGTIAGSDIVTRSLWHGLSPRFGIAVRYEYTVAGRTYSGSTRTFYRTWMLNREAVMQNDYFSRRVGRPVDVYFDPADPEQSVLEPGIRAKDVLRIVLRFVALFLPCLLFVEMSR